MSERLINLPGGVKRIQSEVHLFMAEEAVLIYLFFNTIIKVMGGSDLDESVMLSLSRGKAPMLCLSHVNHLA